MVICQNGYGYTINWSLMKHYSFQNSIIPLFIARVGELKQNTYRYCLVFIQWF